MFDETLKKNIFQWEMFIPPDPMNHVKIFKDLSRRFALSELVPNWCQIFPPDHIDLAEMKKPTGLSNKTSTA